MVTSLLENIVPGCPFYSERSRVSLNFREGEKKKEYGELIRLVSNGDSFSMQIR